MRRRVSLRVAVGDCEPAKLTVRKAFRRSGLLIASLTSGGPRLKALTFQIPRQVRLRGKTLRVRVGSNRVRRVRRTGRTVRVKLPAGGARAVRLEIPVARPGRAIVRRARFRAKLAGSANTLDISYAVG